MGSTRNIAILAFLAGAVVLNPDERSFQKYVESEMAK